VSRNWAIAIGVNRYANLPDLRYARTDAEKMAAFLKDEANFERVYLFTDRSPVITDANQPYNSRPTFGTLTRFLEARFNQAPLKAEDDLWFFFSGHGVSQENRVYLMPSDGNPPAAGI